MPGIVAVEGPTVAGEDAVRIDSGVHAFRCGDFDDAVIRSGIGRVELGEGKSIAVGEVADDGVLEVIGQLHVMPQDVRDEAGFAHAEVGVEFKTREKRGGETALRCRVGDEEIELHLLCARGRRDLGQFDLADRIDQMITSSGKGRFELGEFVGRHFGEKYMSRYGAVTSKFHWVLLLPFAAAARRRRKRLDSSSEGGVGGALSVITFFSAGGL